MMTPSTPSACMRSAHDGRLLTGVLARNSANANLATNLKDKVTDSLTQGLVLEQVKAHRRHPRDCRRRHDVIAYLVKAVLGLRATTEAEQEA